MNMVEQLERLAKLKESGVLTDEEFRIEKEKILSTSNLHPSAENNSEKMDSTGEAVHLNLGEVKITSSRAIFPNKTYSMANVTSVQLGEIKKSAFWPVILMLSGGAGLLIGGGGGIVWALIFIGAGIAIIYANPTQYAVRIGSASGESEAYISGEKDSINQIVLAINNVIVQRG